MRTHTSSHNPRLALAALGLVAALVVAATGGQPSSASTSAVVDEPTASIHDIDFAEVAVPGTVCDVGLRFGQPREIPIEAGQSPVLDLARLTQVTVHDDVIYGDIDGDGVDDAAVQVTCAYGANGAEDSVQVWSLDPAGEPMNIAGVGEPAAAVTGALPGSVAGVDVADGALEVTWTHYSADDPNCCPSLRTTVTYELSAGELVEAGAPVTVAADASSLAG